MSTLELLAGAIQNGKMDEAVRLTEKALNEQIGPQEILDNGMIKAMAIVGDKFKRNEVFVPEMLIAARAMNKALEILEPVMIKNKIESKGTLLIGTVQGDLHDIGKNLVSIMYKGAGFKVVDIGIDVNADKFVSEAGANNPDVIGLSALLTTTMVNMQEIIQALHKAGVQSKIIIGGAPVTAQFAEEIKADGYAADAASAVDVGLKLMNA